MIRHAFPALIALCLASASTSAAAQVVLYDQDFESPVGFVNDGGDVNIFRTVNQLYGGQPPGFTFAQANTVETLLIGGAVFQDPQGIGGQYTLSMLSDRENDLLGLAFNVGTFDFLNLRLDFSSIDLANFGGRFVPPGAAPTFRFSLFDNPSGAVGLGGGTALDSFDVTGVATPFPNNVFDWRVAQGGLDARSATNGNVILRIDLLSGGYAAFDNVRIVASNERGNVGGIPEPATWAMMILGLGLAGAAMRRRGVREALA